MKSHVGGVIARATNERATGGRRNARLRVRPNPEMSTRTSPHARGSRRLVVLTAVMAGVAASLLFGTTTASADGGTSLGSVRIVRDEYGVPHVYAATVGALFFGDGYATAQDRLWQADLVRRTATGTLSELVGPGDDQQNVAGDVFFRGYSGGEDRLRAAFSEMTAPDRAAVSGYVAGINAWISTAARNGTLPVEYAAVGQTPRPWTATDVLASGILTVLKVGAQGFDELHNAQVLQDMTNRLGPTEGTKAFADTHWLDDPSAPTTIPGGRAAASPALDQRTSETDAVAAPSPDAVVRVQRQWLAATAAMDRLGLGGVGHSNAIAVSGRLSATGFPLLLGGPQIGYSVPQGFVEIGLHGAGYDTTGVALAGLPGVQIGVANGHAWTVTSGGDDNQDAYLDVLDSVGHPGQYLFNGAWQPFACRPETILIAGASPLTTTVCDDTHGPVLDVSGSTAVAMRDATRERPAQSLHAFLAIDRARNLQDFVAAGRGLSGSLNLTYADRVGHIAYAHVGPVPIRPAGEDRFLPHAGDGTDEWQGVLDPHHMPLVIDPAQGWLANWNNKPIEGWQNSSDGFWQWGPVHRSQVLSDQLRNIRPHSATIGTLEAINRTAGQTTETPIADDTSVIVQQLVPALRSHLQLSADPRLAPVAAILDRWNQQRVDSDSDGRYDDPAVTIFTAWYSTFATAIVADKLGPDYGIGRIDENTTANVALRLLMGGTPAVPLAADYLQGTPLDTAVTTSLIAALDRVTADYRTGDTAAWLTSVATITWAPLGAASVPTTPFMNRGTYNQIIALGPDIRGENVVAPGQSGDPRNSHFADQLTLYANWQYKKMHLNDRDIKAHIVSTESLTIPG